MDRVVNFLLVGSALAALVVGAIWIGSRVRDDSVSRLTESIPADAAAATADAQLRSAVFAANAYFAQHSTYVGMTADKLRSDVDAGLAARSPSRTPRRPPSVCKRRSVSRRSATACARAFSPRAAAASGVVGGPVGAAHHCIPSYRLRLTGNETRRRVEMPPSALSPALRARAKITSNCCFVDAG